MENYLKIALIHADVRYGNPEFNRRQILEYNRKAAELGSKIIVNTEMGVTGYSFQSREDIAGMVIDDHDELIGHLMQIAGQYGAYICFGFAEKDCGSSLYYNTALVIGPVGRIVLKYRKINAEARWACPGDSFQDNVFDTPWARAGVLICSDTYHGLIPRQTMLKGADIILVPANWPFAGIDPRELWAIRARENAVYIAACNRGGKDRIMTCDNAPSCVISPEGEILVSHSGLDNALVTYELPLESGRLAMTRNRAEIISRRDPEAFAPVYLDMRHVSYGGGNLTSYYGLSEPYPFSVICHTGPEKAAAYEYMKDRLEAIDGKDLEKFTLAVFPCMDISDPDDVAHRLVQWAIKHECAICFGAQAGNAVFFVTPENGITVHGPGRSGSGPGPDRISIVDTGPARIGICTPEELMHPETGIAHAKLGCDILVSCLDYGDDMEFSIFAGRTLDRVAIAVSGMETAIICTPPEGHDRWKQVTASGQGSLCTDVIDPEYVRDKTFQDRIDFRTILNTLK